MNSDPKVQEALKSAARLGELVHVMLTSPAPMNVTADIRERYNEFATAYNALEMQEK